METTVTYLGGVKFEAQSRGHKLVCDQPVEARGSDEGMTPPELMLSSLGTCAAFYAAYYLNYNKLSTEGLKVTVRAEKAKNPPRLGELDIVVEVPGVDESHREALHKSVEKCLIHATLMNAPAIRTEILAGEPAAV